MTVLLHMPLATAVDTHHDAKRGTLRTDCAPRGRKRRRHQRMDPPAGPDPVRDPGLPGARRPAGRRSGRRARRGPSAATCSASESLAATRGRTFSSRHSPASPTGTGTACWPGRSTATRTSFEQLRARITRLGYGHRVRLSGVLTGAALSHAYTTADLLVAPSRAETYGMTVAEALAHGLPVIAADVGGLPEALGSAADGTRPGQLIPPGDPAALAAALGDWLGDERRRHRLRAAARQRRSTVRGWEQTTQEIANALTVHQRRRGERPLPATRIGETAR